MEGANGSDREKPDLITFRSEFHQCVWLTLRYLIAFDYPLVILWRARPYVPHYGRGYLHGRQDSRRRP